MESPKAISSPEEELAYLRAKVADKEREISASRPPTPEDRATIVSERIVEHKRAPAEAILAPEYHIPREALATSTKSVLESLQLGDYQDAVAALAETMEKHGIKNAFAALERVRDPHLDDDFHRYLVRHVAAGLPILHFDEKAPRFKALHMTLYEVALPEPKPQTGQQPRPLKELISAMEQFYAGLMSVGDASLGEAGYFAMELAVPVDRPELIFYVAVPNRKCDLFEKQLLAIFPDAHLVAQPNDYNIFAKKGVSVGARAKFATYPMLPLKDYSEFDYDPVNVILNAFAKIEHQGEGAALQFIIEPRYERHVRHYQKVLAALKKGKKQKEAFGTPESILGEVAHDITKTLFGGSKSKDVEKAREAEMRQIEENKQAIEQVERKISSPIVAVTIRIAVSSGDAARAKQVLGEIESAFNQFASTSGNHLVFESVEGGEAIKLFDAFSYRLPSERTHMPMSLRELTTIYHFPPSGIQSAPNLKQARFTGAAAPLNMPQEGALLGINAYRNQRTNVYLSDEDRLRHLYIIGQTGTGKTGLMKHMIIQDMQKGNGVCYIDPHGTDIVELLASVPPHRKNDVIYFDPADLSHPFALNMLEYDIQRPEQKTFIVNEMLMIFRRLYGDVPESMGPAFEQYFRNATQLVMEDPASGSTLLDIPRVLSNAEFRKAKLAKSTNPVVNQFWNEIASKAGGEASLENIVPYITNKFDDFTANDFIRPIIGQQESSFNFREVIDNKKILLINLSKGRLGEKNANLLGLIVVGKLFMAALSRADTPRAVFPPFYLYIDEFQNVTTDSIPGILSEARKYRLSLTLAHQFLKQIDEKVRDAVFGNVGNMAVFRVGEEDGEFFEKQFTPVFKSLDFVNIENRNAYVKMLAKGVPQKPFTIRTPDLPPGNAAQIDELIHASAATYGRDRASVEAMIRERYLSP